MAKVSEEQCIFLLAVGEDKVPVVTIGIPRAAFERMKDGKTSTFDFTKAGVPLKVMLFGCENHAAGMACLEKGAADANITIVDQRRKDFGIG